MVAASWILQHLYVGIRHLLFPSLKHTLPLPTLTQTNSIWLKLIHSHWILDDGKPSWILSLGFSHLSTKNLTQTHSFTYTCHLEYCPTWIHFALGFNTLLFVSDSLKNTLPLIWPSEQKNLHSASSFIHTEIDDGSHLEFCHIRCSWIQTPCYLVSDSLKNISLYSDSDSN